MASSVSEIQVPSIEDLLRFIREQGLSLGECLALERILDSLDRAGDDLPVANRGGDAAILWLDASEG